MCALPILVGSRPTGGVFPGTAGIAASGQGAPEILGFGIPANHRANHPRKAGQFYRAGYLFVAGRAALAVHADRSGRLRWNAGRKLPLAPPKLRYTCSGKEETGVRSEEH